MLDDIEQDAPFGNLPSVPLQSLFQVRVGHGADGRLGVSVGSLERSDDFCFVGGGLLKGFRVDPSRSGSAHELVEIVVRSARVQKNLGDRAHIRGRSPCVSIGRDGLGQADELAFLDHDFGHHFRAVSGHAGSSVAVWVDLR